MATPLGFTARQACQLAGIGYDRLDHWAKTGIVTPGLVGAAGRGSNRLYAFNDVVALRAARELRDGGLSVQALRRVVSHLKQRGYEQPLAQTVLAFDGLDVYEYTGDEAISTLRQPGQGAFLWLLDVAKIVEEIKLAIAA